MNGIVNLHCVEIYRQFVNRRSSQVGQRRGASAVSYQARFFTVRIQLKGINVCGDKRAISLYVYKSADKCGTAMLEVGRGGKQSVIKISINYFKLRSKNVC